MKITSIDRASNLLFTLKEIALDRSISCSVKFTSHGFCGSNRSIWFSREELEKFIGELEALEKNRRGAARLTAMSPEEFSLSVSVDDSAGHTYCHVAISRQIFDFGRRLAQNVSGSFATDPSALASMLRTVACEFLNCEGGPSS